MRIFLDANILFSAAYDSESAPGLLIDRIQKTGSHRLLTCDLAEKQTIRNLETKFPSGLPAFNIFIKYFEIVPVHPQFNCPLELEAEDSLVFASAVHFAATHFITGDRKDFGPYMNQTKKSGGVLIQTVREFINNSQNDFPSLGEIQEGRRKYRVSLKRKGDAKLERKG